MFMNRQEFSSFRKQMKKTQREMGHLLAVSTRAIHAYEQGWRKIPAHVERQLLLLAVRKLNGKKPKPCWDTMKCPPERREKCPSWEFHVGDLCWLINGTTCHGELQKDWPAKMRLCKKCKVLRWLFRGPAQSRATSAPH